MSRVDLNCDMGESFGAYRIGNDEKVIKFITSANIACGFHASDPNVMDRTVRLCLEHGVKVGAHPGYPDLVGFGRRFMDIDEKEIVNLILYQVGALQGFLKLYGMVLQHVKLHGALYNYAADHTDFILHLTDKLGVAFENPIFLTLATPKNMELKEKCGISGIRIALEAFPDRQYDDEGLLLSRKVPGSVLKDPLMIVDKALDMVLNRRIETVSGKWIPIEVDTLCLHGDNKESIEAAALIRTSLVEAGVEIRPLGDLL
ncbi:MAG: LamB/YcsF family protein [Syntrophales bacterium]|nr:LamB/YcsF family protein [Syntrophales bacterium]